MAILTLKVLNEKGNTISVSRAEDEVSLVYTGAYRKGDKVVLESSLSEGFYVVSVDDALGEELVYLSKGIFTFFVPFEEQRICYSPKLFFGEKHLITARLAWKEEVTAYRNLARNRLDQHGETNCYPHAVANVETRGESVFAAKNAIDGIKENRSHGEWPYGSWGINQRKDAVWRLEFGRQVEIDKLRIYLRADFPHDNWWKQVTVHFSDGSLLEWRLMKTGRGQSLEIEKRKVEWLQLENLVQSEEPSPFPALTQLEVYGVETIIPS